MTSTLKTVVIAGILFLVAGSITNQVFAQAREIRGKVTSSDNQPLPGITVTVKGTKTATVTDVWGIYRITVNNNSASLVFTSVGYVAYETGTAGRSEVNVTMTQETKMGEDVVVIGDQ